MNELDLQRLFTNCPYTVRKVGSEYTFKTDNDIVYAVDFPLLYQDNIPIWMQLSIGSMRKSPCSKT